MTAGTAEALQQIDDALNLYKQIEAQYTQVGTGKSFMDPPTDVAAEGIAAMRATLERLSPDGEKATKVVLGDLHDRNSVGSSAGKLKLLVGALRALKRDYQAGRLQRFGEMVRSDVFSDFLEMAEYLIKDEGLKDPAAVLAGGVLEQHVRKLCDKHGVPTTLTDPKGNLIPKKLNLLNQELAKANAYGSNDQKQVVAWADIRNDAAHAHYDRYTAQQVVLMIQGVRDFLARNPA